jgi:hypothetical protein
MRWKSLQGLTCARTCERDEGNDRTQSEVWRGCRNHRSRPVIRNSIPVVISAYRLVLINGMSRSFGSERLFPMKKPAQHLIAEVPRRQARVEIRSASTLEMFGAITAHTTKQEKWSIEAASEPVRRQSRSGLQICRQHRALPKEARQSANRNSVENNIRRNPTNNTKCESPIKEKTKGQMLTPVTCS